MELTWMMESLHLINNFTGIIKIYKQTFCHGTFLHCSFIDPIKESSRFPAHGLCDSKSNDLCPVCRWVGDLKLDFLGNEAGCRRRDRRGSSACIDWRSSEGLRNELSNCTWLSSNLHSLNTSKHLPAGLSGLAYRRCNKWLIRRILCLPHVQLSDCYKFCKLLVISEMCLVRQRQGSQICKSGFNYTSINLKSLLLSLLIVSYTDSAS